MAPERGGGATRAQRAAGLSIDAAAGRHAISPDIYGISYYWNAGSPVNAALLGRQRHQHVPVAVGRLQ
jgi:hypothetical protein